MYAECLKNDITQNDLDKLIEYVVLNEIKIDRLQGLNLLRVILDLKKDDIKISIDELKDIVADYKKQSGARSDFCWDDADPERSMLDEATLKMFHAANPSEFSRISISQKSTAGGIQTKLVPRDEDLCARMKYLLLLKKDGVDISRDSEARRRMLMHENFDVDFNQYSCRTYYSAMSAEILLNNQDQSLVKIGSFPGCMKYERYLFAIASKMLVEAKTTVTDKSCKETALLLLPQEDRSRWGKSICDGVSLRKQIEVGESPEFQNICASVEERTMSRNF